MTHIDVFNGDADGICSLLQLRLDKPTKSMLVTGVKRDINLLKRVTAQAGDKVTVLDVSMDPVYDVGEESKLRPNKVAFPIAMILLKGFWKRMYYRHFLLETTPVPIAYIVGLLSFTSGLFWSMLLVVRTLQVSVTTPEVVAASLLFMGGAIVLLLAIVLDVLFSSPAIADRSGSRLS